MTIDEIFQITDVQKRIDYLKSQRATTDEEIELIRKQLDPNLHDVTNRKKRVVLEKVVDPETGVEKSKTVEKDVNKIPFAYQDDIVNKRVSFLLSNPVQVSTTSQDKNAKDIISAIKAVDKSLKIDGFNRQMFRTKITFKEVAELWFTVEDEKKNRYGFESPIKIKNKLFRSSDGVSEGVKDRLYPFFDDYGDMIAFSRGFIVKDIDGKDVEYFETWTNQGYYRLKNISTGWVEDPDAKMDAFVKTLKKIPIAYTSQQSSEWYKVQKICDRQDISASNHGDINDRHAKPILKARGEVLSKIEDFIQLKGDNSDIDYISWNQAADSVNIEFDRNEDKIYMLTRTPKTSFEAMKGMGNAASGEGQKMLFLDAHAECLNHLETLDPHLTRRYNIIKEILGNLNLSWKESIQQIEIDIKITPYMMGGIYDDVRLLIELYNSNMISLETACSMNPMFEDGLAEFQKIQAEKDNSNGLDNIMNNNL